MSEPLAAAILDLIRRDLRQLIRELVTEQLAAVTLPQPDPWLTVAEASIYLKLSPAALRARIRRGSIPAHRDGSRYLLDRRELDEDLRRSRRTIS